MTTERLTAGLASQPHQGIGARLVHRLDGAVRNAFAGGCSLAGSLRRPALPRRRQQLPPNQDQAAPPSGQPHRSQRPAPPRSSQPRQAARPGWHARWRGLLKHPPAPSWSSPFLDNDNAAPFTPEVCPGLTAEACTILNTPLEQCDPDIVLLLFAALAEQLAEILPPEAGLPDPEAVFGRIRDRLGSLLGEASLDDARALVRDAAPDTQAPTLAAMPAGPLPEAGTLTWPDAAPTTPCPAAEIAAGGSIAPQPQPVAACSGAGTAAAAIADPACRGEFATNPPASARLLPAAAVTAIARRGRDGASVPHRRSLPAASRPLLCRVARLRLSAGDATSALPPRRLCYAACAGPP